jgi:methionyl-tRNA formyltransferase
MNFDQILQTDVIALPRFGVVNIHPSLLPSLRGPCPAFWALTEGRSHVGASVHRIEDQQIDAGRLLAQQSATLDTDWSVSELTTHLFEMGVNLLPSALAAVAADRNAGAPQDLSTGEYRGFPDHQTIKRSRRRGVRLLRLRHIAHLIVAALGRSSRPR